MNFIPQLCNICKYSGTKFRFSIPNRRWFASNHDPSTTVIGRLKKSDGIDEKFELIYRPPNAQLLMIATSVCSISSIACPTLLASFAFDSYFERNLDAVEQVTHLDLAGMGTIGAITMIALYYCSSIPLRIYSHENEYIAIVPSYIPFLKKKLHFKKGDVQNKEISETTQKVLKKILSPGFETATFYNVNNKKLLLTVKCFDKPIQFYEMFKNSKKFIRRLKQQQKLP